MSEVITMLHTVVSVLLTTGHAIADFANSPRIGWVGIAAIPFSVAAIAYPLTRKCPTSTTHTHEGDK